MFREFMKGDEWPSNDKGEDLQLKDVKGGRARQEASHQLAEASARRSSVCAQYEQEESHLRPPLANSAVLARSLGGHHVDYYCTTDLSPITYAYAPYLYHCVVHAAPARDIPGLL